LLPPDRQYLHFLQEGFFETALMKVVEGRQLLGAVALEGREHFLVFGGFDAWGFRSFMGTFNERLLRVERKSLPPRYIGDRFPRDLLWFYGIERLRVVERAWGISKEEEKLPMLAWK
jgi:hypothetical protein